MIIQCWIIAMLLHVFFVYVSCIFKFEFFLWKSHVCVCVHVSAIDYLHDDIDCSVSFIVEFYSFFLLWYHHHWLYSLIYFIPLFENWLPWKKLLLISESPNKQHSSLSLSLSPMTLIRFFMFCLFAESLILILPSIRHCQKKKLSITIIMWIYKGDDDYYLWEWPSSLSSSSLHHNEL